MLNYEQTVINGVPTKGHNIFVVALNDLNREIYRDLFNSLGSGFAFNLNKYRIPGFVWDMYSMVQKLATSQREIELDNSFAISRHTIDYDETYYKRIWTSGFEDDPGSNLFKPINSYYPMALDNSLSFENQQYKISNFTFNPLVSDNGENEHEPAENTIYKAAIVPLFPLFFASSNSGHLSYGPVFMESFSINAEGRNSLSDVEIKCAFLGGKTLISPEIMPIVKPDIEKDERTIEFNGFAPYEIQDYKNYRTANLSDCLISFFEPQKRIHSELKDELFKSLNITQSKDTNKTNYVFTSQTNTNKIVSMSINISQQISLTHTNPILDDGTYTDVVGPKFASLANRTVTGSVTIFNAKLDDYLDKYPTSSVTMYFGGNFLFHMRDVDWSNPMVSTTTSGSRFHTWNFTARLSQDTGFWGGNQTSVSEFDIDYRSVLDLP
jgi:hypothetical protein